MKKESFIADQLVFAKVRGYPAWPARISSVCDARGSRYRIYFFGTYEVAFVKKEDLWPYNDTSKAKYGHGNHKRKGFTQGMHEIENVPDLIPLEVDGPPAEVVPLLFTPNEDDLATPIQRRVQKSGSDSTPKRRNKPLPTESSFVETPTEVTVTKPSSAVSLKRKIGESQIESPVSKQPKLDSSPTNPRRISRSGRVIKPKVFVDHDGGISSPASGDLMASSVGPKVDKMVAAKPNGAGDTRRSMDGGSRKKNPRVNYGSESVNAMGDADVPPFDSDEREAEWNVQTGKNAIKLKSLVESGKFIPEVVLNKIRAKSVHTTEEELILSKEASLVKNREMIAWLLVEQRMMDLNIGIKTSLHIDHPDVDSCIEVLEELSNISMAPLLFMKQPDLVKSLRRLRIYRGPKNVDSGYINDAAKLVEFKRKLSLIRMKSEKIYMKLKLAFGLPQDQPFWAKFNEKLNLFKEETKSLPRNAIVSLVP